MNEDLFVEFVELYNNAKDKESFYDYYEKMYGEKFKLLLVKRGYGAETVKELKETEPNQKFLTRENIYQLFRKTEEDTFDYYEKEDNFYALEIIDTTDKEEFKHDLMPIKLVETYEPPKYIPGEFSKKYVFI